MSTRGRERLMAGQDKTDDEFSKEPPDNSARMAPDNQMQTPRNPSTDGRTTSTLSNLLIIPIVVSILTSLLTIYVVNLRSNESRPHTFEMESLEQRRVDIDKAIKEVKALQKADKRWITDNFNERNREEALGLQSLKNKLLGVENDVLAKADKKQLEDLNVQIEKKTKEIEESFGTKISLVETMYNEKIKDFKTSVNDLEKDFVDTKESLREYKQEADQKLSSVRATVTDMTETINHDFEYKIQEVFGQMTAIKNAKNEADAILEDIKGDLEKIIPNTFNKEALTTAFLTLTVIVFCLALWINRIQTRLSTGGHEPNRSVNAADVLQQIPARVTLNNCVCIVSFDEARQAAHKALVFSAFLTVQNVQVEYYVVRRHEHLLRLPKCKLYIMCTEFSERHVIIEEPGLGLGDLKRCTYKTIQRYGAQMIILYTRDPGSRNLEDSLYNLRIHCVSSQPELSSLRDLGRFLSTYDKLTEEQKKSLNDTIEQCLQ